GGRFAKDAASAPRERGPAAPASGKSGGAPAVDLPQKIATGEKQVVPLTKMRQTIATRLQQSKQNIPHFYASVDIDCEALVALREKLNKQLEPQKIRLSVSDFVNKAIAVALQQHPAVNAHFDEKNHQVIRFGDVHLGIAVSLPDGLIVPVLKSIDQMGLKEIRQRSVDLAERARAGKLKGNEMTGATFTVSTLGAYGVREFSAIINPPEVGILAVGAAEKRPVVVGDQIVAQRGDPLAQGGR
ncbi:MAG TPA: 2-oxo acid dehydrogenase subunit E2, partial [Tepidisphaeraceae bacterium]|nr:2-oxo acid dehydrogenase subunit E2 [Tepidisphaeraceae bacterium]